MTDFQREITATLYAIEPYIRASHDRVLIHDWQRLLSSDIIERLDPHTPTHIHASHYDEFISLHNIIRDMLWRAYHPNKKEATRG